MAEGARLESVCTRKGTQGSNPCLSAITSITYRPSQPVRKAPAFLLNRHLGDCSLHFAHRRRNRAAPYCIVMVMELCRMGSFWVSIAVPFCFIYARYVCRMVCPPILPNPAATEGGMMYPSVPRSDTAASLQPVAARGPQPIIIAVEHGRGRQSSTQNSSIRFDTCSLLLHRSLLHNSPRPTSDHTPPPAALLMSLIVLSCPLLAST